MKSLTIPILAVALLVASCGTAEDETRPEATGAPCEPPTGHAEETITSGGLERTFLQDVPETARAGAPLVIDLHGYSEGAALHASRTGLAGTADAHGFVLLTPDALPDRFDHASWDLAPDGPDVAFVEDLIDHAVDELCVDRARVLLTGHSQGGFMISTLACTSADRITAAAPVAGMRAAPAGCEPADDVPLLAIHGDADETVPIDGGLSPDAARLLGLPVTGPSIAAIVDEWRARHPDVDVRLHVVPGHGHAWWAPGNEMIYEWFERVTTCPRSDASCGDAREAAAPRRASS